jgi:hypothetical protein
MGAGGRKEIMNYSEFLIGKSKPGDLYGFDPIFLPKELFPFQRVLVEWAIKKGKAAVFADCGLGKSIIELTWAENVVRQTNRPVLFFTPLAVGPQMVREGVKFGIECRQSRDGSFVKGINVTNYEQMEKFNPDDFAGVVGDESGIVKNYDSKTRKGITKFVKKVRYRLLATATPAPNDWMELGSSSEVLGAMGRNQMLGMFFSNGGDDTQQWTLKGHAKERFWQWVCTWARAIRKPSDLGFSDDGFVLPKLTTEQHIVTSKKSIQGLKGFLQLAKTLDQQREERRNTLTERCEKVAELVPKDDFCIVWCHFNPEGDLLEKLIPGAVQVSGKDSDEVKEKRLNAFAMGQIKCLVTKPKIGGWGLNLQHCNRMTSFPSHSFESRYQMVRRCWRFGQKRDVREDVVTSKGEAMVLANQQKKERAATVMFESLVRSMNLVQKKKSDNGKLERMELPQWLK